MSLIKIYSWDQEEEEKILRKKSDEIKNNEFGRPELKKIIDDMFQFIQEQPDGAGLSAPQIGINKRIFVINPRMFDYDENWEIKKRNVSKKDSVFINPKITYWSNEKQIVEEGCFSVRWYYGLVERSKKIKIEYQNFQGEKKEIILENFLAAVGQHEIDHLNGILFIDKASNLRKLSDKEIQEIQNS